MNEITLRRSYAVYWSIICLLVGMIASPLARSEADRSPSHLMHSHAADHGTYEVGSEAAPNVELAAVKDGTLGWNLTLTVDNFRFTPEHIDKPNQPGTGHAHIYVNGMKLARLYGLNFHLARLPKGPHAVTVTLSTNDHSIYTVNGTPVSATTTIVSEEG